MWWIIGIVVYILSFFAIWLFIIQEAKDKGELFETVQDLLDVLEKEEIGCIAVLSLIPLLNTVSSIILVFIVPIRMILE